MKAKLFVKVQNSIKKEVEKRQLNVRSTAEVKKRYLDKNKNLQFNTDIDIRIKSDNMKERVPPKEKAIKIMNKENKIAFWNMKTLK